ncbi:hypothetical protein STEG23_017415, partial [Scotinomys teguina]
MEVLESGEQSVLQWDRKLSELSEPGETEALMYHTDIGCVLCIGIFREILKHVGLSQAMLKVGLNCRVSEPPVSRMPASGLAVTALSYGASSRNSAFYCCQVPIGPMTETNNELTLCILDSAFAFLPGQQRNHSTPWIHFHGHLAYRFYASMTDTVLIDSMQHFSELLDEFSQNVLGQLLNDPFLSEKSVSMEVEPSPTSPAPLIQAEHSYSLSEEPRAQSPFTHGTSSDGFND